MYRYAVIAMAVVFSSPCLAQSPRPLSWNECIQKPKQICIINEALRIARSISDNTLPMKEVADAQAKAGNGREAIRTLDSIPVSNQTSIDDVWDIAAKQVRILAESGMFPEAARRANSISDRVNRVDALSAIGKAQALKKLRKEALATFERALALSKETGTPSPPSGFKIGGFDIDFLTNAIQRGTIFHILTRDMAEAGLIPEALKVADESRDPSMYRHIVSSLVKSGDLGQAKQVAQSIVKADERANYLSEVAEAQARAGLKEESRATFDEAILAATVTEKVKDRAAALGVIAKHQYKAGFTGDAIANFDQCLRLTQQLGTSYIYWYLLPLTIAEDQAARLGTQVNGLIGVILC